MLRRLFSTFFVLVLGCSVFAAIPQWTGAANGDPAPAWDIAKLTINDGGTLTNTGAVEMFGQVVTDSSTVEILAGGIWNACGSSTPSSLSTGTARSQDTVSAWGNFDVGGLISIGTTTNANGYGTIDIHNGGVASVK